jgi:NAD(P)-dependent dehydrogenase (short-subunit alcohol dehydrogenase family)
MGKLDGRVAIITGGSGGIGRAAAKRFVDEGANVLLVDIEERALRDSINAIGEKHASWICADVTSDDETQRYLKAAVERYGRIDILLANAGIEGNFKPIPDIRFRFSIASSLSTFAACGSA